MRSVVTALIAGLLFGAGLELSGMTDTTVVLGFLDLTGDWNPALAFVMGGALAVSFPLYRLAMKREQPLCDAEFHLPANTGIDRNLLVGATMFGLGWGLYGYCPGPAIAALSTLQWQPGVFVIAMIGGMLLRSAQLRCA